MEQLKTEATLSVHKRRPKEQARFHANVAMDGTGKLAPVIPKQISVRIHLLAKSAMEMENAIATNVIAMEIRKDNFVRRRRG